MPTAELGLPAPDDPKGARFHAVADAVVRQLLVRGPGELRYADVARSAGVSRAWIYKYFGSDKQALIDFVVRLFGEAFGGMDAHREGESVVEWRAAMEEGARKGLRDVSSAPWLMHIYARYRHDPGPLGQQIRELQRRFVDKALADLPERLRAEPRRARGMVEAFTAARLGLYAMWVEAGSRDAEDEDAVVDALMGIVDQHVRRCESGR